MNAPALTESSEETKERECLMITFQPTGASKHDTRTQAMVINLRQTHSVCKLFVQSNSAAAEESFILLEI